MDTINQVFALFQINFHNQYFAAFGNSSGVESQAKRLWKESLQQFSNEQILRAAKKIIEQSEYLPTLHRMIRACEDDLGEQGIPDVRSAYMEAANKPSPKNVQEWSHPIVYHAGKSVGWYAMAHVAEHISYPAFEDIYRDLIKRCLGGEEFTVDKPAMIEEKPSRKPTAEAIEKELQELRDLLS